MFSQRLPMSEQRNQSSRSGFSLMSVILALAVVAILAGTLGPLAFRQMVQKKEQQTQDELAAFEKSLLSFYDDTGRLPSEAEGLLALVQDPGVNGWNGPYVSGEQTAVTLEILTDSFGGQYIFDVTPATQPTGTANLIIVSPGANGNLDSGSLNQTWSINGDSDDLQITLNVGPINRDNILVDRQEMQALALAAQMYFENETMFPTSLAELDFSYMDAGVGQEAYVDSWGNNYSFSADNLSRPHVLRIFCRGPDGQDDSGNDDDLVLLVSSVGPGRKSTLHLLKIMQTAVDLNGSTNLTGDWTTDASAFGFGSAFVSDGWGTAYEEAMSSRTILSAGPDANYLTSADNIPAGVVPDDTPATPAWDSHGSYTVGDVVTHNGSEWACLQIHQGGGDPNNAPGIAHSLWGAQ